MSSECLSVAERSAVDKGVDDEAVIRVNGLRKYFPGRRGLIASLRGLPRPVVKAVDGVDFSIRKGEVLGLVGESGCGKTTLGRLILRLAEPTGGKILLDGKDITSLTSTDLKPIRRKMQIVFQDPYDSMNPRNTIEQIISEPLRIQRMVKGSAEIRAKVEDALAAVNLTPAEEYLSRYPHQLSGGQRQRVAVARALVLDPEFIVADEPVSMLDVSIRGEILNLMLSLAKERNVAFLYITHDLATARHICDRIAVMYLGRIMELAPADVLVSGGFHPYTKALIGAVLLPDPSKKQLKEQMKGEVTNATAVPKGCRLHPRCPQATDRCRSEEPALVNVGGDGPEHLVACHLAK